MNTLRRHLLTAMACACLAAFTSACAPREQPPEPKAATPPPATPSALVGSPPGQDFGADARLLYRVVACAGEELLPANLDAATVKEHCDALTPRIEGYRSRYLPRASAFLAALRPSKLSANVVYPFGGGDLLSALTTYPDANEYTTLSLELAGDPRRITRLDKTQLATSLALIRHTIAPLLAENDSTSENLMKGQRGDIPGQVAFFLVALAVHGYEPVALRYFVIEPDGSLRYLDANDIDALEPTAAGRLKPEWTSPDFSPAFTNMELAFRQRGAAADVSVRVHRHVGANLADGPLAKHPGLLRHLEGKGPIAAMTKAASYLLWRADFRSLRQYLLENMMLMISDSTGIPPQFASEAGFAQETFGQFRGSFLHASKIYNDQFRELWASQPRRPLAFRYGYVDASRHFHLLVTRRSAAS